MLFLIYGLKTQNGLKTETALKLKLQRILPSDQIYIPPLTPITWPVT